SKMSDKSALWIALYTVVAVFGVGLNVIVLYAFVKGRLACDKSSSTIYILALQTLCVDVVFISIHLIYWIPKAVYPEYLSLSEADWFIPRMADFLGTFAWFHNALSHVFIASNRFVVLVFNRSFSRQQVILIAIFHHILAAALTIITQFVIPCCRLSFNFSIFSYINVPNGSIPNYSDVIFLVPVNVLSTTTSLICYTAVSFPPQYV
ncbi:hypothetical protein PFISCL1PPCAC_24699, partial [Pristionchus fissidentatus]